MQAKNNNDSWVQQMMANKNYQEFVPSSRPISRTPSESAQSEIEGTSFIKIRLTKILNF